MTQYPAQLKKIEAHIRRRLRSRIVDQQKSKRNLYNKVIKKGVAPKMARAVFGNKGRWVTSHTRAVEKAFSSHWFINTLGQKIRSNENRPEWFELSRWVKLL